MKGLGEELNFTGFKQSSQQRKCTSGPTTNEDTINAFTVSLTIRIQD